MMTPESPHDNWRPLHELTQQEGLDGLLRTFENEVNALDISEGDRQRIFEANKLQLYAHEEQPRGDHNYATHILRVSLRIMHYFGISDPDIIIASLLHDSAEDQSGRISYKLGYSDDPRNKDTKLALTAIRDQFGDTVSDIVTAVTNPDFDPYEDHHIQYRTHVVDSLSESPKARTIKLSDFIDNCTGLIHNESKEHARKLAAKYGPLIPSMRIFTMSPQTELSDNARQYILRQLDTAQERCDELLAA
jgi:(p)ppGpp synthase/HD superfamily hydrolase